MSEFENNLEEDPAADFLAREQADLAGIEDDVAAIQVHQLNGNDDHIIEGSFEGPSPPASESNGTALSVPSEPRQEPEKIRKWREEQKRIIEQKDAVEEIRKEELRKEAQKELEEWYIRYREQIEKAKQANRELSKNAEKEYVCEKSAKGAEWEGIAKMCDFNPKSTRHTKDVSRMKSMILQLKQAPPNSAPKA
ncbi:clathrin light chain-like isoform X2 [Varroa jacobsoni]|uniref:Clathrin light chain n=1 Tax=Varroa destructor TaxID=109461 RepID=A0A7M7JBZ7_VARDE|nr:clathrin light chain-like isoform X2 [Varroa destructor]XP_022689551.1 clathrin light chain-like isoform X2 [Varroa jacobsoni]